MKSRTAKYLLDSYHCDVRLKNTDILRARKLAVANGHYNVSLHLQFIGEGGMYIMFLLIFGKCWCTYSDPQHHALKLHVQPLWLCSCSN